MAVFSHVDFVAYNERLNHINAYAQSPLIIDASLHVKILPSGD